MTDFVASLALEVDITRRVQYADDCAALHAHEIETGQRIPCAGRLDRLCHEVVSDPEIGTGRWATT